MSKQKRKDQSDVVVLGLNESSPLKETNEVTDANGIGELEGRPFTGYLRSHWIGIAVIVFVLLLGVGVMARNGWLPHTDALTGRRTGWFGKELAKNAPSAWSPFSLVAAAPVPTPMLMKEYIYAGSRLLASVDNGTAEIPPADLAVWRPSNATWRIYPNNFGSTQFGQLGDIPVQGDYDGDGKTDFSYMRPSPSPSPGTLTWNVSASSGASLLPQVFGNPGDKPVVADYDGDGKSDRAVWRPSDYNWYIVPSTTSIMITIPWGEAGDMPAPGDYDGDGKADIAIWRGSNKRFYWKNSSDGTTHYTPQFGTSGDTSGDVPVCADYDGDGKANFALKHIDDWLIMNPANTGTSTINWPYSGGTPVPNDYDGDGLVDIAVWKIVTVGSAKPAGYWYIRQSHNTPTLRQVVWGITGDIPVPAYYKH